jgi:hypothetical protein
LILGSPTNQIDRQAKRQRFLPLRICLLVFGVSVFVTLLYFILVSDGTKTKIIKSTTSSFFYNLNNEKIISCPCSTAAMSYSKVLSITPQYHPICSSELVSPSYWSQLFEKGDNVSLILSAHYQLLASTCRLTQRLIENAQDISSTHQLISPETMSRSSFENKIETFVSTFLDQILADYHRTLTFIIGSFEVNQLLNVFTSNWKADFTNEKQSNIIATRPRVFSSSNCSCATTSDCFEQIGEGLVSGCFPFDGFRLSRFNNTSLDELNYKLFVQEWHYRSNYRTYYDICQPTECRYMQFDQNIILYVLVIAIGLYGGKIVKQYII